MSASTSHARMPEQLESGLQQLGALAALLKCIDHERWRSLGGPSPRGLSALLYRSHADIEMGLEELGAAND